MKVVAIGAHVDDIEVGCAGMLHAMMKAGVVETMDVIYFTPPANVVGDTKFGEEYEKAMMEWGFNFKDPTHRMHYNKMPIRQFPDHRQKILQYLYDFSQFMDPDLVLVPSRQEFHQDHQVVTEEAIRAFRRSTMLGYEMPMISLPIDGTFYCGLDQDDVAAKEASIAHYTSQTFRACMRPGIMVALAMMRGNQIGAEYAEAYEVLRWVTHW